ncbi:MAG TPA: DUF503 domain-containing protein [Abditibacteriaceae bacterium]
MKSPPHHLTTTLPIVFIVVLTLELFIHDAHSLKDKRMVVNSILDKLRARFNVSAAQIDDHDLWQRATLAVVAVSNEAKVAQSILNHARDVAEADLRCDVCQCRMETI